MPCEQVLHLKPQSIVFTTDVGSVGRSAVRRLIEGCEENFLGPLPRTGGYPRFFIWPCSHAFATVHSRFTVAGEILRMQATSSIESPMKKRNSTILALRASNLPRSS